jgi:hypothetical protein
MPVGRPDFWYGQVLLFEEAPTDGKTDAGPTSNWAYDHVNDPEAHHELLTGGDVDAKIAAHTAIEAAHHDVFEAADSAAAIATHTALPNAHHTAFVAADADAKILTHKNIASAHHTAFVAADADAKIATHAAIASAHHAKTVSGDIDHGGVTGLADDDHTQYFKADGTRNAEKVNIVKAISGATQPEVVLQSAVTAKSRITRVVEGSRTDMLTNLYYDGAWYLDDTAVAGTAFILDSNGEYPFQLARTAAGSGARTLSYLFVMNRDGKLGIGVWPADYALEVAGEVNASTGFSVGGSHGIFKDRGDPAAYDKVLAGFTRDSAWHDWDLSAIVPAGAKAVLMRLYGASSSGVGQVWLRENGNTNTMNIAMLVVRTTGAAYQEDVIVSIDTNRVIEYLANNITWTALNALVAGWWF